MRHDGRLGGDEAGIGLHHREVFVRELPAGIASLQLPCGQDLVGQIMLTAGGERACHDPTALGSRVHAAGDEQQLLTGRGLQLAPQLVGTPEQRHVRGVLEVGESDDPVVPVRRAHGVRDVVALQTEHPQAAPRQLPAGRGAHRSDPRDDHVIRRRHHQQRSESHRSGCLTARGRPHSINTDLYEARFMRRRRHPARDRSPALPMPSPARIRSTIATIATPPDELRDLRTFHKALADTTRLRILRRLAGSDATVGELIDLVDLSQPLVSWHVRTLKAAGLVATKRSGREVICSLHHEALERFLAEDRALLGRVS